MFAVLCGSLGRFDEAVAAARRAVQLDPLSANAHVWLQWILLVAERYQEVEQVGHAALQLFPDAPLVNLWVGASLALRGDHQRAASFFEKASNFDQIPMIPLFLGLMRALKNDRAGALAQLATARRIGERRYICAYEVASLHSVLGEMDEAYRWMERGLGERCVCFTWLMTEPWMKTFRADPRFPALAAKIGLWDKVRAF
jgi:tetratricopeptide (TPR) repeat protein